MPSFRVIEPLEARVLFTTLPANFSESVVASLNTTTSAAMAFAPDGRLFVGDTTRGQIRVIKNGSLLTSEALNLPVDHYGERGIDGIAFDPNFASAPADKKYVYIYYTVADPTNPNARDNNAFNRLSRFAIKTTNADQLDPASEKMLLDHIPSTVGIHNGGALAFGPDGKIYVGVGEAGVSSNAQSLSSINGKILRLNPDGTIPSDNPFFNTAGARKEIWVRGMRNPFSGSFKPGSSTFYINDVGEGSWEEIDDIQKGKNYGWNQAEGNSSNAAFTNPIFTYAHNGKAAAIVGSAWYNKTQFPSIYQGKYFFGDFNVKTIRYLDPATKQVTNFASSTPTNFVDLDVSPTDGSLYYLGRNGTVYKISYKAPTTSKTLRAVADAYVRDGSTNAGKNFGSLGTLEVKKNATGFNRISYLRFDLSSVASISTGKLRLWGRLDNADVSSATIEINAVDSTTWGEGTITWNNKPAIGAKQAQFTVTGTTAKWYEIDLTSFLKAQKSLGKNLVSIALRRTISSTPNAIFNSDEATSNRPELNITSAAAATAASFNAATVMQPSSADDPTAWELLNA